MKLLTISIITTFFINFGLFASPESDEAQNQAHEKLRILKDDILKALNNKDIDSALALCDEQIVFVPINGETCKGKEAVKAYFVKMMEGPDKIVESIDIKLNVTELTILHGQDTGVVYGSASNSFKLSNSKSLTFNSKWSATLVRKSDGRWLVASFQEGVNPFENPILSQTRNLYPIIAGAAGVLGFIIGIILMFLIRKKG